MSCGAGLARGYWGNEETCLFLDIQPIGHRRVRSQSTGLFLERLVAHVMVLGKGRHDG